MNTELMYASDKCCQVTSGVTVVLVEGEGRGPALAVASLARILLNREDRLEGTG